MVLCRDWLPGIWSKRVKNVKDILGNENRNLSLHYPGADLAYAYTSSELYRHPERTGHEEKKEQNWRDTGGPGPKVKVRDIQSGFTLCDCYVFFSMLNTLPHITFTA